MAKDRVINSQSFHDSKVILYQLENRPNQKWLCRLKVPNGVGYLYRGTGTSDFYEARKFADNLYDELRYKVRQGQSVTGPDFKRLKEFEENYPSEAQSARRAKGVCDFLRSYALPYFSKNRLTNLTEAEIIKFFDWQAKAAHKRNHQLGIMKSMSRSTPLCSA